MADHTKRWLEFWENGTVPWHLLDVHPGIVNHADRLLGSTPKRVFVPLCGKTIDMKWLVDRGHTVIGAEVSEISIKDFFKEHDIPYFVKDMTSVAGGKIYHSADYKYLIYCCDMFALDPKQEPDFGTVDVVTDRGSLEALGVELRPKYMAVMNSIIDPHTKYLLEVVDSEPSSTPPFPISKSDIETIFGQNALVELVDRFELSDLPANTKYKFPPEIKGSLIYFITFQ